MNSISRFALPALFLASTASFAQTPAVAHGVPVARVIGAVNNAQRVPLANSVHRRVAASQVQERVAAETPTGPLRLMLTATPQQTHALQTLLDLQQDSAGSSYRQWLTPEQFGAQFGASQADIAKLTTWFTAQGLTVDHVAKGRRAITFHGTVGQVEKAFGTEMHRVLWNGEEHVANTTPVTIPAAFAGVVDGISSLNDFRPHQPHPPTQRVAVGADGKIAPPDSGGGYNYMSPADFAVIYNTQPLLNAGIDGTGVTIGIVGWSDIPLADVQAFRGTFGLKKNDPQLINIGVDQGVYAGGEGEAELDTEWSGAAAPGATVMLVNAPNTLTSDFLGSSLEYLVDQNVADVISASVAECEAGTGNFLEPYYAQAAAQGISVFASSSDSGSAGCDDFDTVQYAVTGYGVNGWSSTPYNTSVGGLMFDDTADPSKWWAATNGANYESALGYIPEAVWNESGAGTDLLGGIWAGSGGVSELYARPDWQTGPGVPAQDPITVTSSVPGPHRSIPDVALTAAVHDGYLTCFDDGSCHGPGTYFDISGGTSASSPSFAGIQALMDQKYGRQGLINYRLYQLAAAESAASCNSSDSPASTCVFHDVTKGSNGVPCEGGTPDCPAASGSDGVYPEFPAGTGYDFASGLGSVNANNLWSNWNSVTFHSSVTELSTTATKVSQGTSVGFTASVHAGAGSGTPTGNVTLLVSTPGNGNSYGTFALSSGAATFSVATLPAGTYQVLLRYAGDDTFAPSWSNAVSLTVSPASASRVTLASVGANGSQSSFNYGDSIAIGATVAGATGEGAPTGTVTLKDGSTNVGTQSILPSGDSQRGSATSADTEFTLSPLPGVSVGQHTYTASYSGDATYPAGAASAITITVGKATAAIALAAQIGGSSVAVGQTAQYVATINYPGAAAPTGTVQFYNGTTAIGTPVPVSTSGGIASATYNYVASAGGTFAIKATYSGDGNYTAVTSAPSSLTVNAGKTTTVTAVTGPSSGTFGSQVTLSVTVNGGTSVATGSVDLYVNNAYFGTATLSGGSGSVATSLLPGGTDTITGFYRGDSGHAGSTAAPRVIGVAKAAPTLSFGPSSSTADLGQPVALLTAIAGNVAYPTGTVTFADSGKTIATAPLNGNGYYFTASASAPTAFSTAGTHNLSVAYSGDGNYSAANKTSTIVVSSKYATTATVTLTPAAVTVGQPIAINIQVGRIGSSTAPTGTATLLANGQTVSVLHLSNGAATFTAATAGYPAGLYQVQVQYSGDSADEASISAQQSVQLRAKSATQVAVSSSPASPTAGQPVTLTAKVSEADGMLVPGGTVTFTSEGRTLGTGALSGGTASITASSAGVPAGSYVVTAAYSGDSLNVAASGTTTVTLH